MFRCPDACVRSGMANAMLLSAAWKSSVLLLLAGDSAAVVAALSSIAPRGLDNGTGRSTCRSRPRINSPRVECRFRRLICAQSRAVGERSSENPPASDARPGPVVAMLEGAALERAVARPAVHEQCPGER